MPGNLIALGQKWDSPSHISILENQGSSGAELGAWSQGLL